MPTLLSDLLQHIPPVPRQDLLPEIQQLLSESARSVVVLDDDPTGTQTVYEVPVLTTWTTSVIANEFALGTPLFFILTNSRSLNARDATSLARTIGKNIKEASRQTNRNFSIISRSDSTLRGHYPGEVDALLHSLGQDEALRVIAPAFFEGGRYTYQNTHYLLENEEMIPVGETPFAQDKAFGYQNSNLPCWVQEKTQCKVLAQNVHSFDIQDLRTWAVAALAKRITDLPLRSTCIVNALAPYDLQKFVLALIKSKRLALCRTAASFVAVMGGLAPKPLLGAQAIIKASGYGGLTVVGSYVPTSSAQLQHLLESGLVCPVELPVEPLLNISLRSPVLKQAVDNVNYLLFNGLDVVLYTSRKLISGDTKEESLIIGKKVSEALTAIVGKLVIQPRYLIAKGGITSSDLATKALQVKKATVLGQLIPGVPVWKLGEESKYPGMGYVVFPGNVGGGRALTEIVEQLGRSHHG